MHENLIRLSAVNSLLKGLEQRYVFVGGAVVSLYASNPDLADEIRPTNDIDLVIELASYAGYAQIGEKLNKLGFQNDSDSGVICRYKIQGIIVDVMPTEPDVIGFSNRWYPEGFQNAMEYQLDDDTRVYIFTLPYFMASKWEAFKGRGKNDYRTSQDFEDLVFVWENTDDLDKQLLSAPENIRAYLQEELSAVIDHDAFEEGLYAHLSGGYAGAIDANYIRAKLQSALDISL